MTTKAIRPPTQEIGFAITYLIGWGVLWVWAWGGVLAPLAELVAVGR
jgi:hypothetical protein